MSDPDPEPAAEIERLRREISQLRRLRAQLPAIILEPYVEAASTHIKQVAARLAVTPTVPASTAIAEMRGEQVSATQPSPPETAPPTLPPVGTKVTVTATMAPGIVMEHVPGGWISPERAWQIAVLTADGRILLVKPEDLTLAMEGAAAAGPMPTPKISSGTHVKDKASGKTGYVTEIADNQALIALDEGGSITRPLSDLEPI